MNNQIEPENSMYKGDNLQPNSFMNKILRRILNNSQCFSNITSSVEYNITKEKKVADIIKSLDFQEKINDDKTSFSRNIEFISMDELLEENISNHNLISKMIKHSQKNNTDINLPKNLNIITNISESKYFTHSNIEKIIGFNLTRTTLSSKDNEYLSVLIKETTNKIVSSRKELNNYVETCETLEHFGLSEVEARLALAASFIINSKEGYQILWQEHSNLKNKEGFSIIGPYAFHESIATASLLAGHNYLDYATRAQPNYNIATFEELPEKYPYSANSESFLHIKKVLELINK